MIVMVRAKHVARAVVVALVAAVVAACGGVADGTTRDGGGVGPGAGAEPTVVTSFYPLQFVASRVVGDDAVVEDLTRPGAEPHDLELTVSQTEEVVDADVVLYERGFQPAVDQAVAQNHPRRVVDTTDRVPVEDANPHFWLDPLKLAEVADEFAHAMAAVDPAHAAAYRRREADLRADLRRLDAAYSAGLASCRIHTVLVTHDAYGYLSRYGLSFVSINGLSPEAEPSPDHVQALHELVLSKHLTTVFSEPLSSPVMADTLAHDLGIRASVLDPIEGLTDATADQDYLSLMRHNLAALRTANQCR
jgi:zinc transport system substrate-binding protein